MVDHFFDFFQRPEIISAVELQLVLCTVRILCPGGGKLVVDEIVIFAFVDSEVNWFDSFEVSVPSLSGFCQFYLEIFPLYLRGHKKSYSSCLPILSFKECLIGSFSSLTQYMITHPSSENARKTPIPPFSDTFDLNLI